MVHPPTATLLADLCAECYHLGMSSSRWKQELRRTLESYDVMPVKLFDFTDIQGFVGLYYDHRITCVRGTDSAAEAITNLMARQVACDLVPGAKVHRSFLADAEKIMQRIKNHVDYMDGRTDWFCGHSRGGAISQIIAAKVDQQKRLTHASMHPTHLVTFESPRVGNAAFAEYLLRQVPHVRFQRAGDIVPLVPLWPWFRHDRSPAYFDEQDRLRPSIGLLTRLWSGPRAVLSKIGAPGLAAIALHSMKDLSKLIAREESDLQGNLLLELLDS